MAQLFEGGLLSVVSRVDLDLADPEELLAAGRAAYRRLQPGETEEDARVAVHDAAQAVYSLMHENDARWAVPEGAVVFSEGWL